MYNNYRVLSGNLQLGGVSETVAVGGKITGYTAADVSEMIPSANDPTTPGGSAYQEMAKQKFSTSGSSVKKYMSIAAGTAAAGGCAALGASSAAPICGAIGAKIGGLIFDGTKALVGLFSRPSASDAQAALVELRKRHMECFHALQSASSALVTMYSKAMPDSPMITNVEARKILSDAGLPLVWDLSDFRQELIDNCVAGKKNSSMTWQVPNYHRAYVNGDSNKLAWVDWKCSGSGNMATTTIMKRVKDANRAYDAWIALLPDAAARATAAIANLAYKAEVAQIRVDNARLQSDNAALLASNASLARDKSALESMKKIQDAALVLLAAQRKKKEIEGMVRASLATAETDAYIAHVNAVNSRNLWLLSVSGVTVVGASVALILLMRHK